MAGTDQELRAISSALTSRGYHVGREWLSECINFFRSENNRYLLKDLETFVLDQWLLADLREVASGGSLPPNLGDILKTTLEGKMACQVECVTDIGHSSYTQMQKVRNEDVGNLQVDDAAHEFQQAWEPKSNRMLQLSLCDGIQTIKAIEYRPIPTLRPELVPGTKVLLQGPVLCRRGVVMLEERHITVLGGEVDALVIVNAYENVLARKLNLPENPDPYKLSAGVPPAQPVNPAPPAQPVNQAPPAQPANRAPPPQPVNRAPPTQPASRAPPAQPANRAPPAQPVNRAPPQAPVQPPVRPPRQPQVNNNSLQRQQRQPAGPSEQPAKRVVQSTLSWSKQTKPAEATQAKASPPPHPAEEYGFSDDDLLNMHLTDVAMEAEMEYQRNVEDVGDYFNEIIPNIPHPEKTVKNANPRYGRDISTAQSTSEMDMCSDDESFLLEAEKSIPAFSSSHVVNSTFKTKPSLPLYNAERGKEEMVSFKRAAPVLSEESLKKPLFSKRRKETSSQEVSSTSDLHHLFDDEFEVDPFGTLEVVSDPLPVVLPSHPFVYLSLILNQEEKKSELYRVKAAVLTVKDKLCISQGEWKLSAQIIDGSAKVEVRFSGKVLEQLIGMSATAMSEMKKTNKALVTEILAKAQRRLINLNCLMDLEMRLDQDLPVVVSIEELSSHTVSALTVRKIK